MAATTKKDLIDRIAEATGAKHVLVRAVVQQFFDEIIAELAKGNRIEFRDFGVFETKTTPARVAQNPLTLQKVQVPAKRRVAFKAGRLTKTELNGDRPRETTRRTPQATKGRTRHGYDSQK